DLCAGDEAQLRRTLRQYFTDTFDRYESLFECLSDDRAYFEKAIRLRHPLVFYLGHTATFFINKMLLARLLDARLEEHMESIFAVGVDEMSWDDLDDAHYDWPSVADVQAYRDKVRAQVLDIIDQDRESTRLNSSHVSISYAVFCLKKTTKNDKSVNRNISS